MLDLSIVVPGIRTENWVAFCDSVFKSTSPSVSMEIIFVGPNGLPNYLQDDFRVRFICDKGSPTRCSQIGLLAAEGERVMCSCDDALMIEGAQDKIWQMIKGQDRKTVVLGKYTEGSGDGKRGRKSWAFQMSDNYYRVHGSSWTASPFVPKDWLIANFAYFDTSYLKELGGFDCRFESPALPTTDIAIRAQRDGAKFILADFPIFRVEFEGARGGSHGPIYDAFIENDGPLYKSIYHNPECSSRIKIDIDNWKNSQEVWIRRGYGK